MQSIIFSFLAVGPVFLIIALGAFLRIAGFLQYETASQLSRLVFYVYLPALLMRTLAVSRFESLLSLNLLITTQSTIVIVFAFAWFSTLFFRKNRTNRGLFASGACWGNVAMIGYALGESLYGSDGLTRAAILSALLLPIHSVLGVISMNQSNKKENSQWHTILNVVSQIFSNPVIIASIVGIGMHFLPWSMPVFIMEFLDILGRASLPLALVAIGASLNFSPTSGKWTESLFITAIKLLIMPLVGFLMGKILGLSPEWIGSLTIVFSCPTAISFFVVSRNLGHDASQSATIVTMSTVGAAFTTGVVALLLKLAGLA